MTDFQYGFETTLSGTAFDDALQRVKDELKKEGFGVLSEIDVSKTFKEKLSIDFRRYMILGACNPNLAHRAIEIDAQIGLLLPCNVVLQSTADGGVTVSIADPKAMFALVENPSLATVASEAEERLRRVMEALIAKVSP